MNSWYHQRKRDAYAFLKKLEKALNSTLPPPSELRNECAKPLEIRRTLFSAGLSFLSYTN
jgi:hypothetical protein